MATIKTDSRQNLFPIIKMAYTTRTNQGEGTRRKTGNDLIHVSRVASASRRASHFLHASLARTLCIPALFCVHGLILFLILEIELKFLMSTTGCPRSLQECGGDSCLQVVLRYKRLFTKGCMESKWFFKTEKKCYVFK